MSDREEARGWCASCSQEALGNGNGRPRRCRGRRPPVAAVLRPSTWQAPARPAR